MRPAFALPLAAPGKRSRRRAITLLELMVVMLILLMVTAAAIPIVAPALQNRSMRESTRLVTAFFGAAKARAIQTGRPVGVQIERFNGQPFALQMSQVEIPPPYSGDIIGARATVAPLSTPSPNSETNRMNAGWPYYRWFQVTMPGAEFNHKLVKVGDTIQLGGQGPHYTVFGPDEPAGSNDGIIDSPTLEVAYVSKSDFTGKVFFPWANAAPLPAPQPVSYQVFRQPVRTSSPPLVLPDGIVVDLSISGVGSSLFNDADYSGAINTAVNPPLVRFDPQILFSPSGRVEWVTNRDGLLVRPTDPIYLLLGRRDLMFDVTSRGTGADLVFQNLSPLPPASSPTDRMPPAENLWVVIGHQTGQVKTAEMAPHVQDYTNGLGYPLSTQADVINLALNGYRTSTPPPAPVTGAREFTRDTQSLGGR